MGFKVEVLDQSGYPRKGVSVKVIYEDGGQDNGSTDGDGIFDTKGSGGVLKSITAAGKTQNTGRRVNYDTTVTIRV